MPARLKNRHGVKVGQRVVLFTGVRTPYQVKSAARSRRLASVQKCEEGGKNATGRQR